MIGHQSLPEYVCIYDTIKGSSSRAVLYEIDGKKVWVPISQILYEDLGNHILGLPDWFVKKNDLKTYKVG